MTFIRRRRNSGNELTPEDIAALASGMVIKRYKDKTVYAKPAFQPMRKRKPTPAQAEYRQLMREASKFGRAINDDPVRKAEWKKRAKGFSNVYQAVVSWYLLHEGERQRKMKGG
jgi:hypothetical protein